MRYCVIILDGAADWPLSTYGGRTALQAASTPNLDRLTREGTLGLAQTIPYGAEPSSSAACMSILGYDPVANHIGRGAIEAASMGIELKPGDVALRLNLVSITDGLMASYAAGHIPTQDSHALVAELSAALDDETFRLHPGVAYRHVLVVSGHSDLLDGRYTPPHDISGKEVGGYLPLGPGADMLREYMERARTVIAASPVTAARAASGVAPTDVWPFWPGAAPDELPAFRERWGVRAALTSGVDLLNGLAVLCGIDRLDVVGVTDGPDTDYGVQGRAALKALEDHDLVVVHVESPDEASHSGDVEGKIEAIEAIDSEIVGLVAMEHDVRILAMPDHPTPIEIRTHCGEPVPFVLYGPGIARNGADSYDEASAAGTGLVVDPGHRVIELLLG